MRFVADIRATLSQYIPRPIEIRIAKLFGDFEPIYMRTRRYSGYYYLLLARYVIMYDNRPIKMIRKGIAYASNHTILHIITNSSRLTYSK